MWQHKQQERELKRVEGDIAKNQRAVRKTLRDFENGTVTLASIFSLILDNFIFNSNKFIIFNMSFLDLLVQERLNTTTHWPITGTYTIGSQQILCNFMN